MVDRAELGGSQLNRFDPNDVISGLRSVLRSIQWNRQMMEGAGFRSRIASLKLGLIPRPSPPVWDFPAAGSSEQIQQPDDVAVLDWQDSTHLYLPSSSISYEVEISSDGGSSWSSWSSTPAGTTSLNFPSTSVIAGTYLFRVRGFDGDGYGPWSVSGFLNVLAQPPRGFFRLEWRDPDTDALQAFEEFLWTDPEYDPFSTWGASAEKFGSLTTIVQTSPADEREIELTGFASAVPDDVMRRILSRVTGKDDSFPFYKSKILFTDLFGMVWEVKIPRGGIQPIFFGGEVLHLRFRFFVVSAPDAIITPGSGW